MEEQIVKEIRSTYDNGLRIGADVYNFRNLMFKKRFENWQDINLVSSSLNRIDVHVYFQHLGELKNHNFGC